MLAFLYGGADMIPQEELPAGTINTQRTTERTFHNISLGF
jgi:hypothetical protein